MATHHTGYKELVTVSNDKLAFSIWGEASHPSTDVEETEKCSKVNIKKMPVDAVVTVNEEDVKGMQSIDCIPLFYEQRNYEIVIECKKDNPTENIKFVHDNENLMKRVGRKGKLNSDTFEMLSGDINFSNEIGYSTLNVEVDGLVELSIEIEVFPSKIDYQNDYKEMLQDITAEVYNLAYDLVKKTYQNLEIEKKDNPSPVEYLAIVELVMDKMKKAMKVIESYPHQKLEKYQEVVPAHKVKSSNRDTIKWMSKHPEKARRSNDGRIVFEKVQVTKKQITVDTYENQLVKHILNSTYRKIIGIRNLYANSDDKYLRTSESLLAKIDAWCKYLRREIENTFLKNVSSLNGNESMSLVFAMAPGYRELYKCYLLLQKGLSLFGDLYKLSLKDVALLYEYWCFIKLNSVVRSLGYKTDGDGPLAVNTDGMFVTLKKGAESIVEYKNEDTKDKIVLSYNKLYQRSTDGPIVSQKPDNVFSLIKVDSERMFEYIFDAKYRINNAPKDSYYAKAYGTPGPKEDDINTMHRYRDAIVHKAGTDGKYERGMFGAYVLFPYDKEEEYEQHPLYKSIEEVNIGGLPFLPEHTRLVEKFIHQLIEESSSDADKRVIHHVGMTDYHINGIDVERQIGLNK